VLSERAGKRFICKRLIHSLPFSMAIHNDEG